MARRKKEPQTVHRMAICTAAESLFQTQGIAATTMDDIAREAHYSKATIYVYFQSKEELLLSLVLKSMWILEERLSEAVLFPCETEEKYRKICRLMAWYQKEFPLYFPLAWKQNNVVAAQSTSPTMQEIDTAQKAISHTFVSLIQEGIRCGAFRGDLPVRPTALSLQAGLVGLASFAGRTDLCEQQAGLSSEQFLSFGFGLIYDSIKE